LLGKLEEWRDETAKMNHVVAMNDTNKSPSSTDGNTSFLRAARNGQLEKVLEHLESNIDINTSNAVSMIETITLCFHI
jgi:hypothetical protein